MTPRALNRATLARQMLLARQKVKPLAAIERLVGLQAQLPRPPFIGLWTRLQKFKREDLIKLIERNEVVRATTMRATLHLMSRKDYVKFRTALQPALTGGLRRADFDVGEIVSTAAQFFREPRTFEEYRDHLLSSDPKCDARAIAYAVRLHLPLINVPKETKWGYPAGAQFAAAGAIEAEAATEEFVLRYLAAFGPATVNDMQTWSGLRGLKEVFEKLRPKLVTFGNLFDLPKAPRPDEDTDAPIRFLPDYDNVVLGHSDRSRIVPDQYKRWMFTANLTVPAAFLVDGFVAGTWKIERKKDVATLKMTPFAKLTKKVSNELAKEGEELLRFVEDDAKVVQVSF